MAFSFRSENLRIFFLEQGNPYNEIQNIIDACIQLNERHVQILQTIFLHSVTSDCLEY